MENRPQDEQLTDKAAPLQPDRGSRTPGRHAGGDAILLADLADLDASLRQRGAAWKELVRRLDALRREIAVKSAQTERTRVLAARKASRDGGGDGEAKPPGLSGDEARAARLTQEFETALRQTEERRVALHAEMEDLRCRRHALIGRLPAPIGRAYQSLADGGARQPWPPW